MEDGTRRVLAQEAARLRAQEEAVNGLIILEASYGGKDPIAGGSKRSTTLLFFISHLKRIQFMMNIE